MNIVLWSDNQLPMMKVSAYHKRKGDRVYIWPNCPDECDILYKSKVFPSSPEPITQPKCGKLIQGGSGYAINVVDSKEVYHKEKDPFLPDTIEHVYPDYEPFGCKNTAYGFLTRGCPNDCSFCIVSKKEGRCTQQVSDLNEFWRGHKTIKLMDGNLLACKDREHLLQSLINSKAQIDYTQGLDARFITDDIAKLICKTKIKMMHFAFDFMKNEKSIIRGLETFSKHSELTARNMRVYILVNYDTTYQEDYYRVRKVQELGYWPYVMIYQKEAYKKRDNYKNDRFLIDLARWSNHPALFFGNDFWDYIPRVDGKSCKQLYWAMIHNTTGGSL